MCVKWKATYEPSLCCDYPKTLQPNCQLCCVAVELMRLKCIGINPSRVGWEKPTNKPKKIIICYNKNGSPSSAGWWMHTLRVAEKEKKLHCPTSHLNHNPPLESLPPSHSWASQMLHISSHKQSIASLEHCGDIIFKRGQGHNQGKIKLKGNVYCINYSALTFHRVFPGAHHTSHPPSGLAWNLLYLQLKQHYLQEVVLHFLLVICLVNSLSFP